MAHTYPRSDLWASKEVQAEVLDAYEQAEEPRLSRALAQVRPMGYEFTVESVTCWQKEKGVPVKVKVR
jgi:hypothetical protein